MSEAPLVHGFAINPEGGPDIIVEGNRRFVREDEFLAFKAWSATDIAEAKAEGRRQGLEEAAKVCGDEANALEKAMREEWGLPCVSDESRRIRRLRNAIQALATAPAETGESPLAALEGGEQP